MSRAIAIVLAGITVAVLPQPAGAQSFEGVVGQRTISVSLDELADRGIEGEEVFDMSVADLLALRTELEPFGAMTVEEGEILIKGTLVRMDASDEDGPGYALIDLDTGITRMVRPTEGTYLEITPEDLAQMGGFADVVEPGRPEVTETGVSRTINGMLTTAFDVSSADGETKGWVTRDHPALAESMSTFIEAMNAMSMDEPRDPWSVVLAERGLPVLTQTVEWDMFTVEEITSVEQRAVSVEAFSVPDGLQRMTFQDMMGAMPGGAEFEGAVEDAAGDNWIEYEVAGAGEIADREEVVVMCSETDDGFQARSLGNVIIGLEAVGGGEGRHEASVSVSVGFSPERFEGDGTIVIEPTGTDALGLPLYSVTFEGNDLESPSGETASVAGTMSCSVM